MNNFIFYLFDKYDTTTFYVNPIEYMYLCI